MSRLLLALAAALLSSAAEAQLNPFAVSSSQQVSIALTDTVVTVPANTVAVWAWNTQTTNLVYCLPGTNAATTAAVSVQQPLGFMFKMNGQTTIHCIAVTGAANVNFVSGNQ